jgi:hypothetical protein
MHLEKIKRRLNLQSLVRIFFIVCLFCVKSSWLNLFPGKVIWNQCVVNVSIYTTLLERNSNRPAWYNCVICLLYIRFLFYQVKKSESLKLFNNNFFKWILCLVLLIP